jgi:predicted TIM-barrel fold metal-dependent hydrolase
MNFHLTNGSAVPSLSEGSIDAHVHVWTPDVKKYPLAAGFAKQDMAPMSFTPDELFAQCRPEGVARITLIQMSYYGFDNRYMLDSMAADPGVFSGVAIVDENSGNVRANEGFGKAGRARFSTESGVTKRGGVAEFARYERDVEGWG